MLNSLNVSTFSLYIEDKLLNSGIDWKMFKLQYLDIMHVR